MYADVAVALGGAAVRRRRSGANGRTVAEALVRLGDIGVVALSGLLAAQLRFPGADQPDIVTAALLTGVLLGGCIFALLRLYDAERLPQLAHQMPRILGGWVITIAAVLAVLYSLKS